MTNLIRKLTGNKKEVIKVHDTFIPTFLEIDVQILRIMKFFKNFNDVS